jgi:tRNA(fMet)-specific endonuclease VapC
MPSYLLDTNAVIAFLAQDSDLQKVLADANETFISVITLGELYFGTEKSTRTEANRQRVDLLASQHTILVCDADTARNYGRIRNMLRQKGQPRPEADMWIAANAIQYDLTLLTHDSHFDEVDGLTIASW